MSLFLTNSLYRFRKLALVEGISFLLIIFVSMPLKHWMGIPIVNKYFGWAHGILFIIYVVLAIEILVRRKVDFIQFLRIIIASIIPFGTFFNEKMLREQQEKFDQNLF